MAWYRRHPVIEVRLTSGEQLVHRTDAVRGTPDNPMSRGEVEDKARNLLAPILGAAHTAQLIAHIWDLENLQSVRRLRALLSACVEQHWGKARWAIAPVPTNRAYVAANENA